MDALVWKIGDVKVTRVVEIEVERPLSLLFPDLSLPCFRTIHGSLPSS